MTDGNRQMPIRWPYRADRPQRYLGNYELYKRIGGRVDLEELVKGFVSGGVNQGDMARFYFFCLAFDQIVKEDLQGDLAELGVYKGNTATLLATIARARGTKAYLLDTFTGFDKKDITGVDSAARETAFSDTTLESVRALVGEENVCYVRGYFPETAAQLPADGRYCLVHIDCDLYAPILSALEYFYPRMVPGGYLIVHDYSSLHWNGAEKAVDEFFASKPEPVIPLPDGAGSVVIRKLRSAAPNDNWLMRKRASLLRKEWVSAGNGGIRELLGTGWSGPENWGVWGVGDAHVLHLVLHPPLPNTLELEVDVHVLLTGSRTSQQIDVCVAGDRLVTWEFTQANNRGVRRVSIPLDLLSGADRCGGELTVTLRPRETESIRQLLPTSQERRSLSLALHRLRGLSQAVPDERHGQM